MHLLQGVLTFVGYENKIGVVRMLIVFQDSPMVSHTNQKVSARAFD